MKNINTKAKRVKMMKRRRIFFSTIVVIMTSIILCGQLWSKSHKTYICNIDFVNDSIVYVTHPNGLEYGVVVENPEAYQNENTAKVVFNQLTDWEKNYYIVDISPIR